MVVIMKIMMMLFSFLLFVGCAAKQVTPTVAEINQDMLLNPSASGGGETFYIDPVAGSIDNPGSIDLPWSTLEEVVKAKYIETKDVNGVVKNPGAPVKSGDTLLLMTGYHGDIYMRYVYNDSTITVKAEVDNKPVISSLKLDYGSNWVFDGLTVDGSLSSTLTSPKSYMIALGLGGKYGESENIKIRNFHIYAEKNTEDWSLEDWNNYAYNGIMTGNYLHNVVLENNYIENVNLAINSSSRGSLVKGNRIKYFAKDGIRASNSNMVFMHNIITDNLDVNGNHDDGIQGYGGVVGISDVFMEGNVIIQDHDYSNPFPGYLQGIGFFDGPLTGIIAANNVIKIGGYHAISLYDTENARVTGNTVMGIGRAKSRIALGTKNKGILNSNMIYSNTAQAFLLSKDENVIDYDNKVISLGDEVEYEMKLIKLIEKINDIYGSEHLTSGHYRFIMN